METYMNAVTKKTNVVRSTVAKEAPVVKIPATKRGVAKNVDGAASKTIAAKGVSVEDIRAPTKRVLTGRMPLPETLPTSEALPVPAEVALLDSPEYWQEAYTDLMRRDRILCRTIPTYGPAHLVSRGDPFVILAHSVVSQQILVEAAQSVWERIVAIYPELVPT